MRNGDLAPFGANGGSVESDETFLWTEPGKEVRKGYAHKRKILSLIDRNSGHGQRVWWLTLWMQRLSFPFSRKTSDKEARVMTDEAGQYRHLGRTSLNTVLLLTPGANTSPMKDKTVHVNCCENFFFLFKRGMKGVYQHCKKEHLHRYLAEFDSRYNNRCSRPKTKKRPAREGLNDVQRAEVLLKGVVGRRLTYQTTNCQA